ncbi:Glutamate receptor 1 [Operophtera brumata]|uniref:Glutamate receptor 1 n=1 Tax=Operophtera brumata TaxID=104452 RepID=A0A0L7KSD8_OPEBR|nr:Glutamate receptor 1 [Operophtera brumata]
MVFQVLTPTSGLPDYAMSILPDYHKAVLGTVTYYGWKNVIYLYDSHDDCPKCPVAKIVKLNWGNFCMCPMMVVVHLIPDFFVFYWANNLLGYRDDV